MALMMAKLYSALRAADVSEADAVAAAEEVAGFENRLGRIEGDMTLLKWMVGFNLAITLSIAVKQFLGA
jgi:hypothetical protein